MPERAPTIQIPRWIQLLGLPLHLLIAIWVVAGAVRQRVFLFLVAGLSAHFTVPHGQPGRAT